VVVAWFSMLKRPSANSASARLASAAAAIRAAQAHAAAIQTELAEHHAAPRSIISYADAVDLVCRATGWPVGHVWMNGPTGWQSSGAWHDDGPQYIDLKDCTATTDLGSGRGIVAAVLHLGSCRFLPGLEGLGSTLRHGHGIAAGLTSVVGVPVHASGKVVAVMEFIAADDVEPDGDLAQALIDVAARARYRVPRKAAVVDLPRIERPEIEMPEDLAG
jgi:hypothetical protein